MEIVEALVKVFKLRCVQPKTNHLDLDSKETSFYTNTIKWNQHHKHCFVSHKRLIAPSHEADQASSPVRLRPFFIKNTQEEVRVLTCRGAQEYKKQLFLARAFECYVDDQHLNKWINQHLSSPVIVMWFNPTQKSMQPGVMASSLSAISKTGSSSLLWYINYQDLRKKRKPIRTSHENNASSKDVEPPSQSLPTCSFLKELFENIMTDDFYRLSQAVKNGQLSERNSKRFRGIVRQALMWSLAKHVTTK